MKFSITVFSLCLLSGAAAAQQSQFSTNEQINPGRTAGVTVPGSLSLPVRHSWAARINNGLAPPVVANQTVFTLESGQNGQYQTLVARDLATGKIVWSQTVGLGTIAFDHDKIFFVGYNGYVQSFAAGTGNPLWTTTVPGNYPLDARPVAYHGTIYLNTFDSLESAPALQAIDEATGQLRWLVDFPSNIPQSYAGATIDAANGAVIYTALGYIASLSLSTGTFLWQNANFQPYPSCYGEVQYTAVYAGKIFAPSIECTSGFILDAKSGAALAPFQTYGDAFSGLVHVTQPSDQTLVGTSALSGNQIWSFTLPNAYDGFYSPVIANGAVFALASDGYVYVLDAMTGKHLQKLKPGLAGGYLVTAYVTAGEGALLVEAGNQLTVYRLTD